jgi:hypothetical protein
LTIVPAVATLGGATSKPLEIEVDCGTAVPVRFTVDETRLRAAGDLRVRYALDSSEGDPGERDRLVRGAVALARTLLKESASSPIEIYDGPDVWIIPEASVRWVRVHDPDTSAPHRELGFRISQDPS